VTNGKPHIALVAHFDLNSPELSGHRGNFIANALRTYVGHVSFIGPFERVNGKLFSFRRKFYRSLLKKNLSLEREPSLARHYARQIDERLKSASYDLVYSLSTLYVAYLKTDIPIIIDADAVFGSIIDYYDSYVDLAGVSIRNGHHLEKRALGNSRIVFFSSQWAADEARKFYDIDPNKVATIPRGANLFKTPAIQELEYFRVQNRDKPCQLLFMGDPKSWERKGGNIACDTVLRLNKLGIESKLIICGGIPDDQKVNEYTEVVPYLRKHIHQEEQRLFDIFSSTDYLLLPTIADFTPNIIGEANAYGIPVLSTDITGISEMIRHGFNGFLLPMDSRAIKYAALIQENYTDSNAYRLLRENSRQMYETTLNWELSGKKMAESLKDRLGFN
jgi:glycosyltransferase involved in cell wall biosynthesis